MPECDSVQRPKKILHYSRPSRSAVPTPWLLSGDAILWIPDTVAAVHFGFILCTGGGGTHPHRFLSEQATLHQLH